MFGKRRIKKAKPHQLPHQPILLTNLQHNNPLHPCTQTQVVPAMPVVNLTLPVVEVDTTTLLLMITVPTMDVMETIEVMNKTVMIYLLVVVLNALLLNNNNNNTTLKVKTMPIVEAQKVDMESLQSTRNALQKITEAEQSAAQSMNQLGTQSTQIANVNRNIDLAKAHSDRASSQADELKQLNRSIFIPVVKNPFNKNARHRREIERLQADQSEHMNERDDIRKFEHDSNARIDQANRRNDHVSSNHGYRRGRSEADRRRYQFEADEEDDAVEDEIDQNLDLLGGATSRLKNMAMTMNEELDSQNKHLGKLNKKVDPISQKLVATTHTLNSTR
ncbi:unnamed protein product [Absidia cylindrospora]